MKRFVVLGIALIVMVEGALAQTAKILSVSPKGFVVEVEGHDTKQTYLSVQVKLQYSQIAEEAAGNLVFMSKVPFPMLTSLDQISRAMDKYDWGAEQIEEATQQRTSDVEVLIPFEHIKTNDKAQALYLQAVVVHQGIKEKLLAKSQVMKVDVKDLAVIDIFRSEDDMEKIGSLVSAAFGIAAGAMGGDGDCPNCHGKGEVEEQASYGTYTRQCYYCDGTGRDPASSEESADSDSSGSILDLFFSTGSGASDNNKGTKAKPTKQTNSKNTKQTQNTRRK